MSNLARAGSRAGLHAMSTALQTNKEMKPSLESQKPLKHYTPFTLTRKMNQQNEKEEKEWQEKSLWVF